MGERNLQYSAPGGRVTGTDIILHSKKKKKKKKEEKSWHNTRSSIILVRQTDVVGKIPPPPTKANRKNSMGRRKTEIKGVHFCQI